MCRIVISVVAFVVYQAAAFPSYFPFANKCGGDLGHTNVPSRYEACPVPKFFYGSGYPTYAPSAMQQVTLPASLKEVTVSWFLNTDGNPALNVSVETTSQDSAQQYKVVLLVDGYYSRVFCGQIQTPRPGIENVPQTQTFGLEMKCNDNTLRPEIGVRVAIEILGQSVQEDPFSILYTLPSCEDSVMRDCNECVEERKKRIFFHLQQDGNSTLVVLNTNTAYLQHTTKSQVFVTIRERDDAVMEGWKTVGDAVQLNWPERIARFDDLEMGKSYQVLVWRVDELRRYAAIITLKPEQKEVRSENDLMRRKRLAMFVAERQEEYEGFY